VKVEKLIQLTRINLIFIMIHIILRISFYFIIESLKNYRNVRKIYHYFLIKWNNLLDKNEILFIIILTRHDVKIFGF
jgi:hypothetical protein